MLRSLIALLVGVLVMPLAPQAEESGTPSLKDCRALLKSVRHELLVSPGTAVEDLDGGCRFTHIGFLSGTALRFDVDEMIILSPDLLAEFSKNEALLSADLRLNGFSVAFASASKLDMHLAYTTEPDARRARIERFAIDAGDLGRLALSASFSDFDNQDLDAMLFSNDAGRLHHINVALEDRGLVARLMGPLFVGSDKSVTKQKVTVSTLVRELPDSMMSMVSAESLVRFVTALPEPTGNWTLVFESAEGLPLGAINSATALEFMSFLPADASIAVTADDRP